MRASAGNETWASVSPAPAVLRAGAILEAIASSPRRALTIPEIAALLDIPRSSTANICAALEQVGMLALVDGRYRLGRQLVALSDRFVLSTPVVARFDSVALALRDEHDELLVLSRLDGADGVVMARSAAADSIPLPIRVGQAFPATATAGGKAALATLDDATLDAALEHPLLPLTPATLTDPAAVRAELERTRERGIAWNRGESHPGVAEVAVAVDGGEEGRFAVSAWTLEAWADDREARMIAILRRVAAEMTG